MISQHVLSSVVPGEFTVTEGRECKDLTVFFPLRQDEPYRDRQGNPHHID